ncbi:hypothetical protein GGR56DRAFT_664249 [Xylariaceae sp. FL0804]|nr:hypothetical protein GGR56DRAFT_664249 [Xylariaceae sp. FL0804]
MKSSLVQNLRGSIRSPAVAKRYIDAAIGLLFIILNQLLIIPVQTVLDRHSINLPASILVMLLVAILMIVASSISGEVGKFYDRHLRGPTDFLGRHMSFGFVASFVMLNKDHVTDAIEVPKILAAFVITTVISYVGTIFLAFGSLSIERRVRGLRDTLGDLESNRKAWPSQGTVWPTPSPERCPKRISQLSTLTEGLETNGSLTSITPRTICSTAQVVDFFVRTGPIWISLFLLIVVGIPVCLATGYEMPFEAICFLLLWVISVQLQRSLRFSYTMLRYTRVRSILITIANPLLITWALGSAYLWTKTACTGQSIGTVVDNFRHYSSLADCVEQIRRDGGSGSLAAHVGAGDLAAPILDAGIVCLGLKMYEYRAELWSSLATVATTCTALAALNVFANVLVGRAVGLRADEAVAFAGRSVTIALGVPAVQNLGGDTSLMSALAIFSGILFQMAGDWLFARLRVNDRRAQRPRHQHVVSPSSSSLSSSGVHRTSIFVVGESAAAPSAAAAAAAGGEIDAEKAPTVVRACGAEKPKCEATTTAVTAGPATTSGEDSMVVVAGVTVGINAAAMGTAYLIERDSRATAYSALAMTIFGAMTVAFSALPGVSNAVALLTSIR